MAGLHQSICPASQLLSLPAPPLQVTMRCNAINSDVAGHLVEARAHSAHLAEAPACDAEMHAGPTMALHAEAYLPAIPGPSNMSRELSRMACLLQRILALLLSQPHTVVHALMSQLQYALGTYAGQ